MTLYYNGRKVAEKAVTSPLGENSEPLVFGRDGWSGTKQEGPAFYKGLMDEAKFWARPLTVEDLKAEAAL